MCVLSIKVPIRKKGWKLIVCTSCIYIYIYIICHPLIDSFVESELIRVARQARLEHGIETKQKSYHTAISKLNVSKVILTHMYHFCFVCIYTPNCYRVFNFLEELCISRVATGNSFARMLNPCWWGSIDILSSTDCFVVSQLISVVRHARYLS